MFDKAVNICLFIVDFISDQYKTQGTCGRVASEDPLLIVYCPDKYKTHRMCDEAVDNSLAALKLMPDFFVTSKMIKYFLLLCTQMIINSTLMEILVLLYFLVMKWILLI